MINVEQLEAAIEAANDDHVVVRKADMRAVVRDLRAGHHAQRSLTNLQSLITVAAATHGMRVPDGYQPSIEPPRG